MASTLEWSEALPHGPCIPRRPQNLRIIDEGYFELNLQILSIRRCFQTSSLNWRTFRLERIERVIGKK